jgi:N-acetylmuramoyl-L-alanine amidase
MYGGKLVQVRRVKPQNPRRQNAFATFQASSLRFGPLTYPHRGVYRIPAPTASPYNWLVSKRIVSRIGAVLCPRLLLLASLLSLLLAGCQTLPGPVTSSEPVYTTVTLSNEVEIVPAAPLPVAPLAISEGRSWPADWENAWIPLESWSRFNGFEKPAQLSEGPEAVYQLQTSCGPGILKIGSQVASFAGLQYGLGFAPRLIKGLPYIHSLDARKTFQVLINGSFPLPTSTHRTVVIDPGHGGKDSGTRSNNGHEVEKHYALDWARRVGPLLEARGWKVVFTRTNDADVSLGERVAVAERAGADLFLSLHFNSAGSNRELFGLETYCLTPTSMPSNLLREYEDDPRERHPNNSFDELNFQLASRLHRSLLEASGTADRGVRRARFMAVLRGQRRPAVLIEGGYLSNVSEAQKIATPEYRQALAEGVAKALE